MAILREPHSLVYFRINSKRICTIDAAGGQREDITAILLLCGTMAIFFPSIELLFWLRQLMIKIHSLLQGG